jgi:hypothetical protein
MNRFALVRAGVTERLILWDGVSPYTPPAGFTLVPEGSAPPRAPDPVPDPDDIPNEDTRILRRVLVQFMRDSGQTVPQIMARFAAAKRQSD